MAERDSQSPEEFLRMPAVRRLTGLSSSSIYRLIAEGSFPRPFHPSPRTSLWRRSEILDHIERSRVEQPERGAA